MGNEQSQPRSVETTERHYRGTTFNNFACITLLLKYTAEVAGDEIEKRMKAEYDSWPSDLKSGFKDFSENLNKDQEGGVTFLDFKERKLRGIQRAWDLKPSFSTPISEKILERILNLHTNPRSRNIQWNSNTNSATEHFWILAKIFMPYGNKYSTNVKSVDSLSIYTLLKNCKLFSDFEYEVIDQLNEARDTVAHSVTKHISNVDKTKFIDAMLKFLETPCLRTSSRRGAVCDKLRRSRNGNTVVCEEVTNLKSELEKALPFGRKFTDEELRDSPNQMADVCISRLLTKLQKQEKEVKSAIADAEAKKETYRKIGGAVGTVITGGTVGTVGGGTAALATAAVAFVVGAPVVAPAVFLGGLVGVTSSVVGGVLGYNGGRAGGDAVGEVGRIQ